MFVIQDAGWDRRPASDDTTSFNGSSRAGCCGGCGGRKLPCSCDPIWSCCFVRRQMVATLSRDRLGCTWQDGRTSQAHSGAAPGLYRRGYQPDATSDTAWVEGATGGPRSDSIARYSVAVPAPGRISVQKKLYSLLSRRAPISHDDDSDGAPSRPTSIHVSWSLSMKPGSRRI